MHKVDAPGATGANEFTDGNPAGGIVATQLREKWHNSVQEEIVNVVEGAGLTLNDLDNTQLLQAIDAKVPDGLLPFKNALINGGMEIWQRGKTFTRTTDGETYTADRWAMVLAGITVGSVTVTREALGLAAWTIGGASPWSKYFLRLNNTGGFTTAGTGSFGALQKIEGARSLAGKAVVVSFKAKADSAVTGKVSLTQNFGTGGAPSADVVVSDTVAITTAWSLFSVPLTLASISAKTLGSGLNDYLGVKVYTEDGTGVILDVAEIQVEPGSAGTVFEQRSSIVELGLCQRYYEKSYGVDVDPATVTDAGVSSALNAGTATGVYGSAVRFAAGKRAVPTIVWYSSATGASGNVRNGTDTADNAVASTVHVSDGSTGIPSLTVAITAKFVTMHWTAESEL